MIRKLRTTLRHLLRDQDGVALIEFAWTMPLVLSVGCYGIEVANLALMNMRISQIALNLADNASRVGATSTLSTQQLREIDVNDVLQGLRLQGAGIELTTRGRVILSSLENVQRTYSDGTSDAAPVQRIHWQRCIGRKSGTGYDSSYGTTSTTDGTDTTPANKGKPPLTAAGMGDAGSEVSAPAGSGVMFVEINYDTKPLFGTMLVGSKRLHYVASFIVRDRRDFAQLFNPTAGNVTDANKLTCNKYTA